MNNKASRLLYTYIIFVLISAMFITGLSACGDKAEVSSAPPSEGLEMTQPPTPPPTPTIEPVAPGIIEDSGFATQDIVPTDTVTASPEGGDSWPKVPETDPVGDDFFDDAAFLGNSLMDGFRLYSGLTNCDVYASTSMTVLGADSLVAQMPSDSYGKVYILLGINEIDYDSSYFKDLYSAVLDSVVQSQPNADIYICGLSPVSQYKSSTSTSFNMANVNEYNDRLLELADERGFYYIDLCEALAGEDGFLPSECTTDGVHFTQDKYVQWREYLKTHHA